MDALTTALKRADAVVSKAHTNALSLKQAGVLSSQLTPNFSSAFGQEHGGDLQRYSLFRGWLYAAVNALSCEAAGQPVSVGRLTNVEPNSSVQRSRMASNKSYYMSKMTSAARSKVVDHGVEVLNNTPLSFALQKPNSIQHRWQFVYSFVANLNITGWAYIVADVGEDGRPEFYSLPTTWITPVHKNGVAFAEFKVKNPNTIGEAKTLSRENVAFAYLPNPSDPLMSALAPSASQILAIRVDDHIQTSQERFFENGVFPSVIVTVGKDPHPDVPSGIRPRLSGIQRRQVTGAIRKTMSGVANYGNPAIVDGLIEGIQRISATQNEMGWEKSEDAVMDRILSAFSVPPFILGKALPGSYSQAYVTREIFCQRVNTFLDMLGTVMTNFVNLRMSDSEDVLVWWDKCNPVDPSIKSKEIIEARKLRDITQDEYRAHLGLPPAEKEEKRSKFFDSPASMRSVHELLSKVTTGEITSESASQVLAKFFEIPLDEATTIVGDGGEAGLIQESMEMLESAVAQLKEPVEIRLDSEDLDSLVAENCESVDKAVMSAESNEVAVESLSKKLVDLTTELAVEKNKRECDTKLMAQATKDSVNLTTMAVKEAVSSIQSIVVSSDNSTLQTKRIDVVLEELSSKVERSFAVIQKTTEQPINVQVTNEVNPTPLEITNKVETPKVEVDVKNEVKTPEVNVEVEAPNVKVEPKIEVNVEAPVVNVDSPNVKVEPKIEVDIPKIEVPAAEVDVNITRDDAPNKATITHPDGRVSQVELKE